MHCQDGEEHVQVGSLTNPERQLGGESVVGEEIGYDFNRHKETVKIEHPPVVPAPFYLVFWSLLLCFVDNPPRNDLMRNEKNP